MRSERTTPDAVCAVCAKPFNTLSGARSKFCTRACFIASFEHWADRFWSAVSKTSQTPAYRPDLSPCWLWTKHINASGYGVFSKRGRLELAHRTAYGLVVGDVPPGLQLDHLCRVRHCVNPDHLEPVTNAENVKRGVSPFAEKARQTHCKRGHVFDESNTYRSPDRPHTRRCRTCVRDYQRVAMARKRRALREAALVETGNEACFENWRD